MRKEGYYWVLRECEAYFHNWERAHWDGFAWKFDGEENDYLDSDLLFIGEQVL